ncbi:MAG: hypothetical protein ACHP9Y_04890 [Gammaproteobacteria bacterium]
MPKTTRLAKCPICDKKVNAQGLGGHISLAHKVAITKTVEPKGVELTPFLNTSSGEIFNPAPVLLALPSTAKPQGDIWTDETFWCLTKEQCIKELLLIYKHWFHSDLEDEKRTQLTKDLMANGKAQLKANGKDAIFLIRERIFYGNVELLTYIGYFKKG